VAHARGIGHHGLDFGRIGDVRDERDRPAVVRAVRQILGAQLVGARDGDRADAQQRGHREQPIRDLRQHDDHPIALANARVVQDGRPAFRRVRNLLERIVAPATGGIDRDEPRARLGGKRVHDVASEVKVLGTSHAYTVSAMARGSQDRTPVPLSTLGSQPPRHSKAPDFTTQEALCCRTFPFRRRAVPGIRHLSRR